MRDLVTGNRIVVDQGQFRSVNSLAIPARLVEGRYQACGFDDWR